MISKRRTVGLDVGTWAVKAVELEGSAMKPILRNLGLAKLAPGVIEDGEWKQTEDILKGLAGLWWRQRFGKDRVVGGLGGPQIHVRRIRFEKLPEVELRKRVPAELKFYLPFDPETTALDFQIIDRGTDYQDLLVVAIPNNFIQRYVRLLNNLGLQPSALEVPAIGLYNLWDINYPEDKDSLIINIGSALTQLVYIQGRKPLSIRTLVLGTRDCLTRVQKQLGLDYASAERALAGERNFEEVPSIIIYFAQELIDKLEADRKFLSQGYSYATCYLSGGGSLLPHLAEYLRPRLNCTPFEPFRKIEIPLLLKLRPELQIAPVFTLAAGLALRGLYD
jgi:type IV pilus assembly protein PilM